MKSERRLIYLLWAVIAALIIGAAIGGYLLVRHANDVDQSNLDLTGDNNNLKRQLLQAQTTPSPSPTPTPLATPEATPTPSPTVAPKATATPKPAATPKR